MYRSRSGCSGLFKTFGLTLAAAWELMHILYNPKSLCYRLSHIHHLDMSPTTWQDLVADKKRRQQAAIPSEWVLKSLPDSTVLDVRGIPEQSGILSPRELEITSADVETLLHNLASSTWSSVEVTTAFYKRAIIAHQLVRSPWVSTRLFLCCSPVITGELLDRNLRRTSIEACSGA